MTKGQAITVRQATIDDIEEACAIDFEAFSPYGTAELSSIVKARWTVFPQGFLIAQIGENVVGYGSSEKWLSEREPAMNEDPFETHNFAGKIFCITAMAVKGEWRKHGVASAILDSLIQVAKVEKCKVILLETTHAEAFYIKRGFSVSGEREQMNANLKVLSLTLEEI